MHNRERYFALLNDNRRTLPFEWGTEHLGINHNDREPRQILSEFANQVTRKSDEFFAVSADIDFSVGERLFPVSAEINPAETKKPPQQTKINVVTWKSGIETESLENNTAIAAFFPAGNKRDSAVIVLPHWNAKAGTYFDLCRVFNRFGIAALRLTLPYHEDRMPPGLERADHLVSPNIGRTIQSVRQAVLDARAAVHFLKNQGYRRIGIVGTSIGSCVAFLSFVHDLRIDAAVFNHVSGYMADVVWRGLSTYHVKKGLVGNLTLEELRQFWLPVSPMAYMGKLARMRPRPQRYIYTKYDLSFPIDLSLETIRSLRQHGVEHSEVQLPCGHYTLGEKPWVYLDGFAIVSYLRKHLKTTSNEA